jgi:GNAT superfamily N-acetyltransferase
VLAWPQAPRLHCTGIVEYNSPSVNYHVREATLADADVLVRHRIGMFSDMGVPDDDAQPYGPSFREWLKAVMPAGVYRAWLLESDTGEAIAGGAVTIIPWPPGPRYVGGRVAYVYNVYTEPGHRKRGHARTIMLAIHDWCRETGIWSLALNASQFGQSLYESMGYQITDSPMMFLRLE